MTQTNYQLTVNLTAAQFDLFSRIAAAKDRKIKDLTRLIFAEGLRYYFCEDDVSINKKDNEYTKAEKEQISINNKIEKENINLSHIEKEKLGYKFVDKCFRGGGYSHSEKGEDIIDNLEEELRQSCRD